MTFIDLCSGIGGFHYGMENLNCLLACDINKECRESYKINHKINCKSNIVELDFKKINDFNILCAGFPCQPFSSAGLKKGMNDERSNVYYKIIKIIKEKNPDIIFLENVKNLLTIQKGEVMKNIKNDLENLNYYVSYSVLNTANFGLAQNRKIV